jgi:hypothetical protein
VLAKIAMILGVVNGVIGVIPGIVANTLGQYTYRQMEDKMLATLIAAGLMILAWLTVLGGALLLYRFIVAMR